MDIRVDYQDSIESGFLVKASRKRMWVVELELLEILDRACVENNINYFLLFGSAIGAVRHKGFIPWDDDIDLGMMRNDFENFIRCIDRYLPEYVDIQYGMNGDRFDPLLRMRDSRTTGIVRDELDLPGSKGVFIEVYVFDYVEKNLMRQLQIKISKKLWGWMFGLSLNKYSGCKKIFLNKIGRDRLFKIYNWVCQIQNNKERKLVDTISLPYYAESDHHLFYTEDLKNTIYMDYEYTKVRIPKAYDRILKTRYGNYMELPPETERGAHHNTQVYYDPDKSYLEYESEKMETVKAFFNGDLSLEKI